MKFDWRRLAALVVVMGVALSLLPTFAFAQVELSAGDIIRLSPQMDGKRVAFSGEAVGDVLKATTGGVWVNILSDGTAVGVWTDAEGAADITTLGEHKATGDTVVVHGTFNFACDLHAGDMDVHAESLEVVERGGDRELPVAWWKLSLAGVLGAIALALGILYRRRPHFI